MRKINLHLISDSTGETVCSVARACIVQFEGIEPEEFVWTMIRTRSQLEKVLKEIEKLPGVIMYTVVDPTLRDALKDFCNRMNIPCIPVLSRAIADLSAYLNMQASPQPGKQHSLTDDYFSRVEAINFAIAHDDGQATWDLDESDIVLVGVSRTSKSPTCMYLAYRGYRTSNIPFVINCPLPDILFSLKKTLIVGLTISPERLVQIRKTRLIAMNDEGNTDYVDIEKVSEEIIEARKLYLRNNWPIIDVTRKSVEETAANVIQIYQERFHRIKHP